MTTYYFNIILLIYDFILTFIKMKQENLLILLIVLSINGSILSNICKSGPESNIFLSSKIKHLLSNCKKFSNCTTTKLYGSVAVIIQVKSSKLDKYSHVCWNCSLVTNDAMSAFPIKNFRPPTFLWSHKIVKLGSWSVLVQVKI